MIRIKRNGSTLIEVLVVVAIAGGLMSIILPAVMASRGAARRIECQNKMRQLGLALTLHADANGALPPGTSLHPATEYQGWYVRVLPFLEDQNTYSRIEDNFNRSRRVFDPRFHPEIFLPKPTLFGCPEDARISETVLAVNNMLRVALTSYQGCAGQDYLKKDGVLFGGSRVRYAEVLDGMSNTIVAGERPPPKSMDYGWWYAGVGSGKGSLDHTVGSYEVATSMYASCSTPTSFGNGKIDNECDVAHFWSLHTGVCNFAFLDGSVRSLTYSDQDVLNALSTRAGYEVVPD